MSATLNPIPAYTPKDPKDRDTFQVECAPALNPGETFTVENMTVAPLNAQAGDGDLEIVGEPVVTGSIISYVMSGGRQGVAYEVAADIVTSGGRSITRHVHMLVRSL